MNTKVAIKQLSNEHGKKVVSYLESIGGNNEQDLCGNVYNYYYFVNAFGNIDCSIKIPFDYTEITLPNQSEGELMWVWDGDGKNPKDRKRIVIWRNEAMCVAVTNRFEDEFKNGKFFDITWYYHCAPIESEEVVIELTMEEVCSKLGMNVKIVKR